MRHQGGLPPRTIQLREPLKEPWNGRYRVRNRWQNRHNGNVYFPNLWNDDDGRWNRNLNHVRNEWNASNRLCLLCD